MRYLQETTDWDCGYNVPNHIYIVENGRSGRALGYIQAGTTTPKMFKKPAPFDRKHRTFTEIKPEKIK